MNSVILTGNLTKDVELKYTVSDNPTAVCKFQIAVNEGYGDNQRVDYPSIVVFGKQAENCERFLHKGSKVAVSGRIQTGSYENREGKKVYTTEVIAEKVEFLGSKQDNRLP